MGRGRIPMELIEKEKARNITYQKRKNGLMKKVGEFSTLCGIDVCLIIHGPNMEGEEPKVETWPHESEEVHRIIDKYHSTTVDRRPKVYDVEEYYKDRMRKIETEISRVHKEKLKLMYPIWDDSFNALGEQQLRMFVSMLDAKLDACNQRINMLKTKPDTLANYSHFPIEPQLFPPPMKPLIYQTDNNMLPIYPFLGQSSHSPMLHNYDQNCVQLMDSVNQVDAVTCDPKKDGPENNHNTSPFLYNGNMQTIMPSGITQYGDFETSFLQPPAFQLNGFCDANMPQPPMFNNMHGSK